MRRKRPAVLGIDAAWNREKPSGVALWGETEGQWKSLHSAASFEEFCHPREEVEVQYGTVTVTELVQTCTSYLKGQELVVVAVDMPMSKQPIRSRRCADNEVSRAFAQAKCPTHSPMPGPSGALDDTLRVDFEAVGFQLVTSTNTRGGWALIEVYPHVSLLGLMQKDERLKCKVGRRAVYWPQASPEERKERLLREWRSIRSYLQGAAPLELKIPSFSESLTLSELKAVEDHLDAHICAWTAVEYLEGRAYPLGCSDAAIWIPESARRFGKN